MKRSRSTRSEGSSWTAADHAMREEKNTARSARATGVSSKAKRQAHRTAVLTHDTLEKRTAMKVRLHLTKIQREIAQMKEALMVWDPSDEAEEKAALAKNREEEERPKKKGRKGPETWKLRGAARPAWEVYDFDTRYVDPNMEAHKKAQEKAKRSRNLLAVLKGRFACPDAPPVCRDYLGLLMQWGHLSVEAKQYKTARSAWLECMELEGNEHIVTTAREDLMRLYLQLKRYEAALRLGRELGSEESVWIRYPAAWVAVEIGKDQREQEALLVSAVRANPFCAYFLAFYDTFSGVMEYTEDIEDTEDQPQSSFEEALEYCKPSTAKSWQQNGATTFLRSLLRDAAQGSGPLSTADVDWENRLSKIEQEYDSRIAADVDGITEKGRENEDSKDVDLVGESGAAESGDEQHDHVDLKMFSSMFRTAMEMLEESGELNVGLKSTSYKN